MNKIFKVVWSKTKECYVVVSEVAKNNGGKKKVLATVFAALVATGSMLPDYVDAANNTSGGGVSSADASIAIGSGWDNSAYANTNFSIAIGDQSNANGKAAIALGRQAKTNGEEAAIAIGNQTEATSKDSTAVGSGSKSSGEYAAALGFQTKATANYATAIGSGARGYAEDSQAIGREAETSAGAFRAIAIGTLSKSSANYATSLGSSAEASAERAIAVGYKSKAKAESAISVGNLASADNTDSIAVGNGSAATANYAVAVGSGSAVSGLNGTAVGKNSQATGQSAAAFGDSAQATNTNATAVGNKADASNTNTTAIGNQTVASGGNATAVGHLSQATDDGATAIGTNNKAGYEGTAVGLSNTVTGRTSAAFGRSNTVSGNESLAAGIRSTASGERNVAIGYQAVTNNKATVAIGEGSKADIADGVAIGSNSATTAAAGVQGFNPADSRTNTYGGLTGTAQTSTLGAVAVGNGDTATRQITGLAAGKENTDAVNVAQLRSVNLKYAADTGNSDLLLTDGTLTVKGDNDLISTSVVAAGADKGTVRITAKVGGTIDNTDGKAVKPTTNGIATTDNVADAINKSYWKATAGGNTDGTPTVGNVKPGTQVTYSAGDNLKVKQSINATTGDQEYKYSLNPVLTGITSISNATTGPKMTFGGNSINITGGSLDMGTNKIINLAPGTADNDAVNVKQLKDTELHITPGTYTPDASKKVKLTYTNGNNTVVTGKEAIIDLSGLATGGTASTEKVQKAADAANDTNIAEVNPKTGDTFGGAGATYEVSVSRNAVKDAAREAVTVNNGGTTTGGTYTADTNNPISVTAKPDNTNHNTTYEVTFDGNKAAKQIPLTYKATNGTTTTADQTVKLDKGLNFTGGDYTTASVGADGKVTFDVNLGTVPTVTDGKPGVPGQAGAAGKDGIATVKTVVDTINNSGWKANAKANGGKLDGNSTATVVKPGDQVNFAAGKNLTVKQDLTGEHTYTYSLNKDLKDLTSVEIGGSTIKTDGDHITITSPDTNPGATPGATVTNKVANLGDEKHIKPDTYAVANDGSVTLKYVDGNSKELTETTKITGITNQNLSNISTDGETKIKNLAKSAINMEDGKNTKASKRDVNGVDTYKVDVEGDLTGISSITNGGTNNGKISFGPNKTVTVDGDHSITLNASTGKIGGLQNKTFDPTNFTSGQAATEDQLKSVHDTLKANERHIAPTTVAASSTENKGGTANAAGTANVYKYDATNKTVTLTYNDGNGNAVNDTKAVIDFSALNTGGTTASTWTAKTSAENTTAGSEIGKHAGDASQVIGNQNSVDFQAGRNMTVTQTNDGTGNTTINYALDKDLTNLDKVVVNGENGTNGKDGVTIIGPQGATGATGMPGTNGIDGKVGITGKDGKDAVSISGKDGIGTIGLTGPQGPAGADGRGVDITTDHGTQTLNKPEANNGGKSERIVYVPKDKDGNPLKDDAGNTIKREVATMDDGLKFTGNNESTENKHKLGSLVKVQGEGVTENTTTNKLEANGEEFKSASGNIAVVADSIDKLTVKLNKNLAGINKISNGGSSITLNDTPSATTPAVTITGGNLSMGDGTTNNKIVNLAPGTDDNDAVNYKQLKAAKTEVKAGENVTVKHTTDGTDNHNIYTVSAVTPAVYTKADGTKVYKIVDPTTGAVTWNTKADGTGTNVNAGDVITSFETPANGTTPGSTTGGTMIVNNIGSAIKNQTGGDFLTKLDNANTATPNAAVNVSDLKSTADALKANERHIAPTTVATGSTENKGGTANAAGTANVYKYDAASKTVTLTYNDGNGNAVTDTKAVIDLSNLSTGGTGASSWNIASDKVSATEGAVATGSAGTQNIADGKTVTMKAGKNLTVNQVNDGAGNASVAFSLDKNLENLDKVVVNGNDGATGQAGVSIVGPKGANGVDGNDGKVGIAGKDGKDAVSISGKDGVGHIGLQGPKGTPGTPGADGASLDISTDYGTQTLVKPEANNNDKSERIVYVPKDANGNPLKDTDGNTIKREVATMDDGLKFTGNNTGTVNKHKLGSLVKVQGEGVSATDEAAFVSASGNIAVTAENNDTLTIRLNKNLKGLNSIQLGGNTIQSNGDNITFTTNGGTTKTVATTDQLWTIQANGTDVPAKSGKVNLVAGDHITITPDAANGKMTISATGFGSMDGFNVKTSAESTTVGTHAGDTTENIKNGKTVDMQAGKNLVVTQTNDGNGNTTVNYALNKDVDLGTNGSLKAGDTTINKDGVTIANGPSVTKTGVDAGDKKITNVADGDVNATSKDAVNGSQLKKYTDAAKTTVEAGDNNVKVDADNTAADGHTNYKVSLKPVVTIGDTHKVTIDGHTGDITGLTNVNLTDPTFATKGRAATEEQLDKVLTEAKKKAVEKVQAGTAAAGDTNIATVAPKAGDTFGTAGATYEVSVSKNAVKDAAKEAVKVTSASPAITVTADNTTPHETTYKVGFDGNQAATQIPLTYKQNGGNTRTVKLSDGLNFIDGTNTKARTAADGKVTFDVMGDLTGITSISNAAGGPKMTFGGNSINVTGGNLDMGGKKITNIGKGTDPTDAARVGQLTKVTSNNHSVVVTKTTDADGAPVYDLAVTGTPGAPAADPRVDMLGEEIGRVGAQGAALSALKPIQYDPLEPTQIMAGYGNYRGNSAVALGVAHYKNESTLIHGGVSWAGGSSHMMANAGVTWKVGNRDSEAAVADRYRKGPISSAYAMQQEMAAMKAQNAGLKGEVSDLKAENEQMKAQIAAMMAKLGL